LFYKNLTDNKTQTNNGTPNINEIKEFWSNIWSNEVQFNNQAECIPHLENDIPDVKKIYINNIITKTFLFYNRKISDNIAESGKVPRMLADSNNRHHIQISHEILVENINSSHNWKSPGGDQTFG
jgi:hypothetical protein